MLCQSYTTVKMLVALKNSPCDLLILFVCELSQQGDAPLYELFITMLQMCFVEAKAVGCRAVYKPLLCGHKLH